MNERARSRPLRCTLDALAINRHELPSSDAVVRIEHVAAAAAPAMGNTRAVRTGARDTSLHLLCAHARACAHPECVN